jgi:hypothetical protein
MLKKKKTIKWFKPKVHSGWSKDDKPVTRRRKVYASHKRNALSSARSLQSLANVTQDKQTSRLAQSDANYFYKIHKKTGR